MASQKKPAIEKMYTLADVMNLLDITRRTLYRYIDDGRLQAVKIARRWYVNEKALQDFMSTGTDIQGESIDGLKTEIQAIISKYGGKWDESGNRWFFPESVQTVAMGELSVVIDKLINLTTEKAKGV
jgi:excisionase family DNA binding protein